MKAENGNAVPNGDVKTDNKEADSKETKKEEKKEDKKEKKKDKKAGEKDEPKKGGELKETPSGLKIKDHKIGTGKAAKKGDKISMRYVGKFPDGKVFDSNTKGKPVRLVCLPVEA